MVQEVLEVQKVLWVQKVQEVPFHHFLLLVQEFHFLLAFLLDLVVQGVPHLQVVQLDQETLDGLYVRRRLSEQDLSAFDGGWRPA